jgi:hypothetical protein
LAVTPTMIANSSPVGLSPVVVAGGDVLEGGDLVEGEDGADEGGGGGGDRGEGGGGAEDDADVSATHVTVSLACAVPPSSE